jgi:hypothetical protein
LKQIRFLREEWGRYIQGLSSRYIAHWQIEIRRLFFAPSLGCIKRDPILIFRTDEINASKSWAYGQWRNCPTERLPDDWISQQHGGETSGARASPAPRDHDGNATWGRLHMKLNQ